MTSDGIGVFFGPLVKIKIGYRRGNAKIERNRLIKLPAIGKGGFVSLAADCRRDKFIVKYEFLRLIDY